MSVFLLVTFIVAVLKGKMNEVDDAYFFGWALFSIADALWAFFLMRCIYGT